MPSLLSPRFFLLSPRVSFDHQGLSFGHKGLPFGDQGQRLESSTGQYGVCWDDAGVTKAPAHQLSSSRCSATCYGRGAAPACTNHPTAVWVCSLCSAKCFQADWCNANIFSHSTCCHLVVIRVILPFITLHPSTEDDGIQLYILCTITLPNRNTTYHAATSALSNTLHPPPPSLLP